MSLCERFAETSCIQAIHIGSLDKETPYSVVRAERMNTKYGVSILLTIKMSPGKVVSIFLPKRYTPVFSDVDIDSINNGTVKVDIVYRGTCEQTNAHLLSLRESLVDKKLICDKPQLK
jgi:hypothetical protein